MTRYEELREKANACRMAAARLPKSNRLHFIWLNHAAALEAAAANLPLVKASEVIK